jgi:gliding motility associated protien GldN
LLKWKYIRENDVLWKKTVWRVIDVRQKINHHFSYPPRPFIKIIIDAVRTGELYAFVDDEFTDVYVQEDIIGKVSRRDTIEVLDPYTYDFDTVIVNNDLNPEEIIKYRIKEVWYFDKESSSMKVRIAGIAPLRDLMDSNGIKLGEEALFWIYYPDAREYLSTEKSNMLGNEATNTSWDDVMEMRMFDSFIYKEANMRGLRIKDYSSGVDLMNESKMIENEIFNYEQDFWSR